MSRNIQIDSSGNNKRQKNMRVSIMTMLTVNLAFVIALVAGSDWRWKALAFTEDLYILLSIDDLSRLFLLLVATIWLIAGIYAISYMKEDKKEGRFFAFYLLTLVALTGVGLAGNYLTLYLFFELMTLLSVPLVLHTQTKEAIDAAKKYLYYSVTGASMALLGMFLIIKYGGSSEFVPGGTLDILRAHRNESLLLIGAMLSIVGFGAKAGMFPLHAWLPAAHPVAPTPASAVLSGIITKAGVLAIIRVVFYQFGTDFIRGTWVQSVWIILSLVTIFMGSMLAYKESQFKKRLAYSSVSQISYILFGLSLLTASGMTGALLHMTFHAIIKNGLFMAAGAVILFTDRANTDEIEGVGKEIPIVMWCFTLLSTALVGIPPLSGSVSKWFLASGALSSGLRLPWAGPVILLTSALLTAGYLFSISMSALLPSSEAKNISFKKVKTDNLVVIPIVILTVPAVLFGMFPTALIEFFKAIAEELF